MSKVMLVDLDENFVKLYEKSGLRHTELETMENVIHIEIYVGKECVGYIEKGLIYLEKFEIDEDNVLSVWIKKGDKNE